MVQKSLLLSVLASTALGGVLQKRYTFPLPESQGSQTFDQPHEVAEGETYDGGMKTFGRGLECTGQAEGGEDETVFIVQEGGTLKNAIIGPDQLEGVYCKGSCTIENVWWEDVCEDALSLKGGETFTVSGGGAQHAEDKVIQHNSGGTLTIDGFTVYDFGKLYRSCGNCDEMPKRTVIMSDVTAISGSKLAGVNINYGDTATIEDSVCVTDVEGICTAYKGNESGDEPEEVSSGPSDACLYTEPLPECS